MLALHPGPAKSAPFRSADAAWFWTVTALRAARDPAAPRSGPGPCRPETIVKTLDTLYRQRRLELLHARILRIWGLRGYAPNPARNRERCDWKLWREALDLLEGPLREQGIISGPGFEATEDEPVPHRPLKGPPRERRSRAAEGFRSGAARPPQP